MNINPGDRHIGERVKMRREKLGLLQNDLACELSATAAHVERMERGEMRISASNLFALAKILDVPSGYFFEHFARPRRPP